MTASSGNVGLDWTQIPSAEFVYNLLRERASLQAQIRRVGLEIAIEEANISQKKPRDKMVRVVGIGEDSAIIHMRYELIRLQDVLDSTEAELKMFEFRKEIFKTLSYKERY